MTHDELIGRTATAICRQPGSLCAGQCHQEICRDAIKIHEADARAAIRVIAPAVLEDAAGAAMRAVLAASLSKAVWDDVSALKTRYEQ